MIWGNSGQHLICDMCCMNPHLMVTDAIGDSIKRRRDLDDSKLPSLGDLVDGMSLTKIENAGQ